MFFLFGFSVCVLSIANAHYIDVTSYADGAILFSLNIMLISGCAAFSDNSMRHRSVVDVFFIWATWIFMTDWVNYIPSVAAAVESAVFTILAAWVYFRPYKHQTLPPNPETVCIAFYGGPNAPFLSRLVSHFGFAFSSVALVAGSLGVRPSKSRGTMAETTAPLLMSKGYVFVDTGVPISPKIHGIIKNVIGTPTGYGVFYFRCLLNLRPILDSLGVEWVPKKMRIIPALYYRQCIRNLP